MWLPAPSDKPPPPPPQPSPLPPLSLKRLAQTSLRTFFRAVSPLTRDIAGKRTCIKHDSLQVVWKTSESMSPYRNGEHRGICVAGTISLTRGSLRTGRKKKMMGFFFITVGYIIIPSRPILLAPQFQPQIPEPHSLAPLHSAEILI